MRTPSFVTSASFQNYFFAIANFLNQSVKSIAEPITLVPNPLVSSASMGMVPLLLSMLVLSKLMKRGSTVQSLVARGRACAPFVMTLSCVPGLGQDELRINLNFPIVLFGLRLPGVSRKGRVVGHCEGLVYQPFSISLDISVSNSLFLLSSFTWCSDATDIGGAFRVVFEIKL